MLSFALVYCAIAVACCMLTVRWRGEAEALVPLASLRPYLFLLHHPSPIRQDETVWESKRVKPPLPSSHTHNANRMAAGALLRGREELLPARKRHICFCPPSSPLRDSLPFFLTPLRITKSNQRERRREDETLPGTERRRMKETPWTEVAEEHTHRLPFTYAFLIQGTLIRDYRAPLQLRSGPIKLSGAIAFHSGS